MRRLVTLVVLVLLAASPAPASAASLSEKLSVALSQGSGVALLFALAAGLATALTPCVFPMIPITVAVFGAKAGVSRSRAMLLAAAYVGGMALTFGVLGTGSALLGKAFGSFLTSPYVIIPIAGVFLALALSFFGAFELNLPGGLAARLSRVGGAGVAGAFLMGLVAAFIAAPCTGPPLALILGYIATTGDVGLGFALSSTYALGIGLPFFAVAGFAMSLPKSGPWMEGIKSAFGIVLLVVTLYFLKNVVPDLWKLTGTSSSFMWACLGAVAVAIPLGAIHLSFHGNAVERVRKGAGVVLAVIGLFAFTNYLLTPKGELSWHHDEGKAKISMTRTGNPMLVDFGADWCLPCKKLEANIFTAPAVAQKMENQFTLLKIDCTNEDDDPRIAGQRARFDAGGGLLPAVRVVHPDGRVIARLDNGDISPDEFLSWLDQALHAAN